ncbi:MAG TPA: carboxypeptidase regulatory-like domain-containing protein [Pyrinomonadaceae bacterium]|nr:carboxypeptidase regulatory-like domain-containing protein [Pyrinomonadaceae bacterium]
MHTATRLLMLFAVLLACLCPAFAQNSGSIAGDVRDEKQAVITGATVNVRNIQTNETRTAQTNADGRYHFANLAVGNYEITVESTGFAKYQQQGITLALNQAAVVDVTMKPGAVQEVVNVVENASMLNTSTPEVGTRFDEKRLSELPLATTRSVYNIALSAPGVSQINSGQSAFAGGTNFSSNGGRTRSNNFMIDGQDNNNFGVAGSTIPLNNPDAIQEVRLVTNQFSAEYGRNSSAVFNAITRSGTNQYHGSGFWFHNDNALNACSNVQKAGLNGFCNPNHADPSHHHAPFRIENQLGGTIGGPLHLPRFGEGGPGIINGTDRTFFFFAIQRWWDRQLGVGQELKGAPTAAGKEIIRQAAGDLPQVRALLDFLPAAATPLNQNVRFERNGQTFIVPVGALTGSQASTYDDWQTSVRIDHRLNDKHSLNGRYLYQDSGALGSIPGVAASQITPPGFSSIVPARTQGVNLQLTSVLTPKWINELRGAFLRSANATIALDPRSELIPSMEVVDLGLSGFNAGPTRTAIGLGVNLPQNQTRNTYQIQDNVSYTNGNHAWKFGADIRRNQLHQLFKPTTRGLLEYPSLDFLVKDLATRANINKDLPGTAAVLHSDWHDFFFFGQDEWRIKSNFTLTLGLRYENAGQPIGDLVDYNQPVLAAFNNDPRFVVRPIPGRDNNNWQPRLGFNWNPQTRSSGLLGWLTGGDKLVLRGGYTRTHDYAYTNILLNIWSSFPFVAAVSSFPTTTARPLGGNPNGSNDLTVIPNAFTVLQSPPFNPNTVNRTIVDENFHMPLYDSVSLEVQREFTRDLVLRVGYVGTKGTGLFESVDANPAVIGCTNASAANQFCRTIPNQGPTRLRTNSGMSIYHSLQTSLEKRLSRGFSAGLHYTYSSFIDTMSEIFNVSSGEIAVAQDSYNRAADRARSSFDRPHRIAGNFVYELPWFQDQKGAKGLVLGGWQFNSQFSLQSGSPFTPLNGSDPAATLASISALVGNAIRPNLNTTLDLSSMSVEEILQAGGRSLFRPITAAQRVGNAGRNILRSDGINNIDFGILKNTRIGENQRLQLRADFFNATNSRDFGIPDSRVTSANFLNQWGTDGGNRRIIVGVRYVF